jgi:23S rRNA pseudouridine2605 synthase
MTNVDRLQKILSQAGVASRRASEQLMVEGRVTVNGTVVRELGSKADAGDDIRVDGRRIKLPERHRYVLLNKPRGLARVYEADVLGVPDAHDVDRLARGVTIDGRRTQPADVQLLPGAPAGHATLRITVREGRNRQVRNMFDAVGHPVDRLTRVAIGPIKDARLKPGRWRDLERHEIAALKRATEGGDDRGPQRERFERRTRRTRGPA